MDTINFQWGYGTGHMTIHVPEFFPCPTPQFRKLLKVMRYAATFEEEQIVEALRVIKEYLTYQVEKMPDLLQKQLQVSLNQLDRANSEIQRLKAIKKKEAVKFMQEERLTIQNRIKTTKRHQKDCIQCETLLQILNQFVEVNNYGNRL